MSVKHIVAGALGGFIGISAATAIVALSGAADAAETPTQAADRYKFFDPIVDVQALIDQRFVEEPDFEEIQRSAIDAMIEALGDRYSEFIPARDIAEFDKQTRGSYVGIGAEVRMDNCWLIIASPLEDSPAFKAGVMAEDRVTEIDGVSTCDLSLNECIARLTGEPGTPVTITVERAGQTEEITIVRQKIETPVVKGVHYTGDGWEYWINPDEKIAYVRLTQFTVAAARDVTDTLRSLSEQGMQGLVLDLRFNPGGLLGAAIQIADLFLEDGTIVSTKGRNFPEQRATAREPGTLPDFPMIVLVNRTSASASEIVAGALADNGRAKILGERSFGKGSVQEVIPLPSGAGQLKLTEKYYYLPSGRSLHRKEGATTWGVDPSKGFYVPMSDDEWREMTRLRRESEIIRAGASDAEMWADPDWILEHLKDKQLAAAVRALSAKVRTGEWVEPGEQGQPETLAAAELERTAEYRERLLRELARVEDQLATLEEGAGEEADEALAEKGPLPGDAELEGGSVEVFDKSGKKIATLKITGPDLNRWLFDAPVAPAEQSDKPN
ncbi:MAG: S41 family peptidase [Phycisphaerales bacterium]